MKSKNPILRRLYEYGVITLGCALYALCFNWCFQPNNISMGGFTGDHQPLLSHLPHRRHGHRAEYPPVLSGGAPAGGAAAGLVPVRHERGVADDRRPGGDIHLPAHGAPAGVHLRRGDAGGVHGADAVGGGHHRGHGAGGPAFEVQAPRAVHRAAVPEHRRGGYFPVRSDLPQLQ